MEKKENAENKNELIERLAEKFKLNLGEFRKEQEKMAKKVVLKDSIDFSLAEKIAACSLAYFENKLVTVFIIFDLNLEIIEEKYFIDRTNFPYISGFRAYRELSCIISCYNKLENVPDLIFIEASGILHPRKFGLASHLALAVQKPVIGITDDLLYGEEKNSEVFIDNKIRGFKLISKEGAKPLYISPGSFISPKTALELTKKFIRAPHKLPEPIVISNKYAKKIREELFKKI
jgi:deoxyribonuclease V